MLQSVAVKCRCVNGPLKMATNDHAADAVLSEEAFHLLFLVVEENECLWRIDHENYKNVVNKGCIWKDICKCLQERFPKPGCPETRCVE